MIVSSVMDSHSVSYKQQLISKDHNPCDRTERELTPVDAVNETQIIKESRTKQSTVNRVLR